MNASLIRKTAPAEVKVLDDAQGIVEAYVNTMDVVDYDGEVIAGGAFDRYVARGGKLPKVAWFHQQAMPVGKCLETMQIDNRQRVVAQFNLATQRGREAFSDVQFGAVDEWSVGFYSLQDESVELDGKRRRRIVDLDWVEFSPVMRGASPQTATIAAKTQAAADELEHGDSGSTDEAGALGTDHQPIVGKALSFEEVRRRIDAMLNPDTGSIHPLSYTWVLETYATYVIVCRQAEGELTYWRIDYFIDPATDDLTVGGFAEVEQVYVPVRAPTLITEAGRMLRLAGLLTPQERAAPPAPATDESAAGTDHARALLYVRRLQAGLPAAKIGARNSTADTRRIQAVHDAAVELGATCAVESAEA